MNKMEKGKDVIILDAGDLIGKKNYRQKSVADIIFQIFGKMKCNAILPGEQELSLGIDELSTLSKANGVPLVCANIIDKKSRKPIFKKFLILDLGKKSIFKKKIKIGITGAIDDALYKQMSKEKDDHFEIQPLSSALKEVIPYLEKKVNIIILLLHTDPANARKIHGEYPNIDFVLNAHELLENNKISEEIIESKSSPILRVSPKGSNSSWVDITLDEKGRVKNFEKNSIMLKEDLGEDAQIAGLIDTFEKKSKPEKLDIPKTSYYLTAKNCRKCHLEIFKEWVQTPHARAYDTLVKEGKEEDRICLACHVTGAGYNMGFGDLKSTPELINVQCEACHGKGNIHIEDTKKEYGKISISSCTRCHNNENDPDFDFQEDYKKVMHTSCSN